MVYEAQSYLLLIAIVTCWLLTVRCQNPHIPQETVDFWAEQIGKKTFDTSTNIMASKDLLEKYKAQNIDAIRVDGKTLTNELANKLEQFFNGKVSALRDLATEAEKAKSKYVDDEQDLTYHNAKSPTGVKLTYDPTYDTKVNTETSVVHIPLEVYDRDPKVADDIKWTKTLNQVFIDNDKKYPGLSWQYFGSAEGIHRQYPARLWPPPPPGKPDLYDSRRRPWYIQGASSPKDVVLLIDRSGSLLGLRAEIAKLAATVIVDTLSTNDFFHVVLFNNETNLICCDRQMLQATRGNKEFIKDRLKNLQPTRTSDWEAGLTEAFKLLKETKESDKGSGCQQAIIILSDGSAVYEKNVFAKYNADGKIRVFSFVVGPPQYGVKELKEIACDNKGYFLRIPSVGAVWETVTTYIRVLSRPVGASQDKPTVFTSVFVDATGGGLVSTGSTPVFENPKQSNSKLLGVMATDVLVKDLSEFVPLPLIGHNGYLFAIDNNGLILIHPGISGDKLSLLVPQPNMDLDEMEFAVANHSLVEQLRERMILSNGGSMKFETFVKSSDELRVRRQEMEYYFVRSQSSPFSIGVASPKFGFVINKPKISMAQGKIAIESVDKIKRWPFCSKIRKQENVKESLLKIIEDHIANGGDLSACDSRFLNGLLLDAVTTDGLKEIWKQKKGLMDSNQVEDVFLRTNWGIVRTLNDTIPYSENMTSSKEADLAVAPWDYYSRAVQQDRNGVTVAIPPSQGRGSYTPRISIYAPIDLETPAITVAVTGMEMSYDTFADDFFVKETLNCRGGILCDTRLTCDRSQKNEIQGLYCYLLDENAFVVASNQKTDTGKFFGLVDSQVMLKLTKSSESSSNGIYELAQLPDYQAACKLIPGNPSSASRLFIQPLLSITNFLTWAGSSLASLVSAITIPSIFSLMTSPRSVTSSDDSEVTRFLSCIKNTTLYTAANQGLTTRYSSNATCSSGQCERRFSVASVPQTNLFLVVVESTCGKCLTNNVDDLPGIPGIQKEIVYNETVFIQPSNRTKPRRRPDFCFPPADEKNDECGGCRQLFPCIGIILLSVLISITTWM